MYKAIGYVSLAMSIFFLVAAVFVAVTQILPIPNPVFGFEWTYFQAHPEQFNYLIALLLGAYGIFRFRRSYKLVKNNEDL